MRTCGSAVVPVVGPVVGAGDLEIGAAHLLDEAGDGDAVQRHVKGGRPVGLIAWARGKADINHEPSPLVQRAS
jgi:hypothetical protein